MQRRERGAPEEKVYGKAACRAVFERRREDIRRAYVEEARIGEFGDLLSFCAKQRIAYHVVGRGDLDRVTASKHHEGICLIARVPEPLTFDALQKEALGERGSLRLVLLEGVKDPHNVGAILRVCAHFGVRAALSTGGTAKRSSALLRSAEGGAEHVPLVEVKDGRAALHALKKACLISIATSSHATQSLFSAKLPERAVVLFGAERSGLSRALEEEADLCIAIPGTGAVESLNVAAASAIVLTELWRRHEARSRPPEEAAHGPPRRPSRSPGRRRSR